MLARPIGRMAMAACGCGVVREVDGSWVVADANAECPFHHGVGLKGWTEGEPTRVTDVGECVTIVFERASRTAMLTTTKDAPRTVAETRIATPAPRKTG